MSEFYIEPLTTQIAVTPRRATALQRAFQSRTMQAASVLLLLMIVFAFLVPHLIARDPYSMDVASRLTGPSAEHMLGTDNLGRDLLARIASGASTSLFLGFSVALCSAVLGTLIGILASFYTVLDHILMRICDGLMAIPAVLLAVALSSALGPSVKNTIIALSIVFTPSIARLVRSRALAVRSELFVEAGKMMGARGAYLMWRHILPNTFSVLAVQTTFVFADSIITEAALSFLGAGVPAPEPSWGNILYDGKSVIVTAPHMVIFTSIALIVTVAALNLLGDGLRDIVDKRGVPQAPKRSFFSRLLAPARQK